MHLFNLKMFIKAWANIEELGLNHDHPQQIPPYFASCWACNMSILTRYEENVTIYCMWVFTNAMAKAFSETFDANVWVFNERVASGVVTGGIKRF